MPALQGKRPRLLRIGEAPDVTEAPDATEPQKNREPQSGGKQNNKTLRQQALNAVCQFLHAIAFTDHCVGGNPSARERSGDRFGIHGE
jgi:hypothetical protein